MDSQNIFIAHPTTSEQLEALKAFVKALKIKFEITNEKTYNPDFVAKIEKSKQQFEKGEFTRIEKGDLQEFLGL
jgi:transcription antitermination factor NusG